MMIELRETMIKLRPETTGILLGMAISITSGLITWIIASKYIIPKTATSAAEETVKKFSTQNIPTTPTPIPTESQQRYLSKWKPLSYNQLSYIHNTINEQ